MGAPALGDGPRACVVNLGCKVNRIESDWIETALVDAGLRLTPAGEADVVVVNTCAVTGEAQAKTRKAVRHAAGLPGRPPVVVTGCVASLFPEEIEALGPNVHVVSAKADVVGRALGLLAAGRRHDGQAAPLPHELDAALPRHGEFRVRRGVKVQDGCDNKCTYCIVWRARGQARSADVGEIEAQVRRVLEEGASEVVLSGINLGKFRTPTGEGLEVLIDRLCAMGVRSLRASSVEPPDVSDAMLDAMARHGDVVCPHLHLPLQAGCDRTLRRMGRTYTVDGFARTVERVRSFLPSASISTDVIAGFPGESDGDFAESLAFCGEMGFSKMHVFRFSARPGTEACAMADQVPADAARSRSEALRRLADRMRADDARKRVGTFENVLVERIDGLDVGHGTTASYHDARILPGPFRPSAPGLLRAHIDSFDERARALELSVTA